MSNLPDQGEVVEREIRIAARPETVFPFFTDPQKMMQWKGVDNTLDARAGGMFRVNTNGRDVVRGRYVEITPFSRIVFTWGLEGENSPVAPGSSTVEVLLIADGDETVVRLRHMGLQAPEIRRVHALGWDHYLPRLVEIAEGRDPGKDPWTITRTMGEES